MKRSHVIITVAVLIFAGLVILRQFSSSKPGNTKTQTSFGKSGARGPVSVQTSPAALGYMRQEREFTGTVKASYSYVVSAKVSGRLLNLSKRIGDKVSREEIIGRIDDTEYRQAFQEADAQKRVSNASISEARAQLEQAQREEKRVKELVSKGISSQAELETAQTQLASLQSRLELATAQMAQRDAALELAKTRLAYTRISSAQPGLIAERHVDGGSQLSVNTPIYTIVGIDTVFVEIGVTERDYSLIRKGQKAKVYVDALPGKVFTGEIARRAPMFQTASRTAIVEVSIDNDSLLLKPGMFAKLEITLQEKDSALAIPSSAIINRGQGTFTFVLDSTGNSVKLTPVTTGIVDGDYTEILSPVIDRPVVTIGAHLLSDGAKVITAQGGITQSQKKFSGNKTGKEQK